MAKIVYYLYIYGCFCSYIYNCFAQSPESVTDEHDDEWVFFCFEKEDFMNQMCVFSARLGIFNSSLGQVNTQTTTTKKPVQKGRSRLQQQHQIHDENVSLLSQPSLNPLGICQIYTGTTCENYLKNQVSILPKWHKNADTHNFLSIDLAVEI